LEEVPHTTRQEYDAIESAWQGTLMTARRKVGLLLLPPHSSLSSPLTRLTRLTRLSHLPSPLTHSSPGETALTLAVGRGGGVGCTMVSLLLAHGANHESRTLNNMTALKVRLILVVSRRTTPASTGYTTRLWIIRRCNVDRTTYDMRTMHQIVFSVLS
jgi:hypothetical protein